jgi:hypothetical protein
LPRFTRSSIRDCSTRFHFPRFSWRLQTTWFFIPKPRPTPPYAEKLLCAVGAEDECIAPADSEFVLQGGNNLKLRDTFILHFFSFLVDWTLGLLGSTPSPLIYCHGGRFEQQSQNPSRDEVVDHLGEKYSELEVNREIVNHSVFSLQSQR